MEKYTLSNIAEMVHNGRANALDHYVKLEDYESMKCCENCSNNPHKCYKYNYDKDCYEENKKHWK